MTDADYDMIMKIAEAMRRAALEKYRKEHPENPGADLVITDIKREANRVDIYARIVPEPPSEIHLVAKVALN
jgi:hypothetical protein